ncbi:asparagine synthase (glutamine-hydrolyzing) [bacterium]|nr:asparagine synthase (glutamine-hydrolyzing) [bacterium]HPF35398.1 asparagine synthase (glutamine-hydrolyzing) [Candidatus Krumholzibacteria bacterium]HRX51459.1 asparagine synthase (glutamine-hydrolyzing) [Candidatus Krumholzibacteria bacterium]
MCGITGAISLAGTLEVPAGAPERMIGALSHRGPDEYGTWSDGRVLLGHARLSIIDLGGGQQPMGDAGAELWVSFNGEIFNYIELREDLRALGHVFRTDSDTEVILEAYRAWGDACVERFNGQFAFVLADRRRRRVLLARDRFGIRPLFWARHGDVLLFGSEVKALAGWPGFRPEFDPAALGEILHTWVNVPPHTPFRNVRQLPAGHRAAVELDAPPADLAPERYWHPTFLPAAEDHRFIDEDERARWSSEVREALADACEIRLRADVPVGGYLSGGLDSSATTALVRERTGDRLKTFSVGFTDAAYDESLWQHRMAQHLGTDHESIRVGDAEIAGGFPRVVWHAETPLLRTAPTPLYALSGLVREQDYKVVLTGEGADEVFCGYNILREAKVRAFWARDPESVRRPRLLGRLYPYLKQSPPEFLARFYGQGLDAAATDPLFSHRPRWSVSGRLVDFLHADHQPGAAAGREAALGRLLESLPADFAGWGPVARAQYLEMTLFMAGYLLSSQGDRMLMGHTVEGRFPFLDHRVAALAGRIPAAAKLESLREKALLKRAVADLLPESILQRPKQPYRAPDSASFFTGYGHDLVGEACGPEAVRTAGVWDPGRVAGLLRKWDAGRMTSVRDNMAFTVVLSTQLLARQFGPDLERRIRNTTLPPGAVVRRGV